MNNQLSPIKGEKLWSILVYVPFFNVFFCALAAVKFVNSKLMRFHVRQGLVVFVLWFFVFIISLLFWKIGRLLWILIIAVYAILLFMSFTDKLFRFPLISQIAEKIPEYYIFTLLTGKNAEDSSLDK